MKISFGLKANLLVLLLLIGGFASLRADEGDINITKVTTQSAMPQSVGGGGNRPGSGGNRGESKWYQINVEYTANPAKPFLDEVQFKVYVEMEEKQDPKDRDNSGDPVLLTGEVTYVNIPKSRDTMYCSFYLHPNTIERYGGERGLEKHNVHVEAYVGGTLVASADKKKDDPDWIHGKFKSISGMVLTKDQSPWALADLDLYPAQKQKN